MTIIHQDMRRKLWHFNILLRVKMIFFLLKSPSHISHTFLKQTSELDVRITRPSPPPPQVVYATDRAKAVAPVLFLLCVALWCLLRGASCFIVFPCSLPSCFFIRFSIVIRGSWSVCFSCICLFVLYVLVFFHFSLPIAVGGWLRFVIVALPVLLY